jgi:hypothetical protein
MQGRKVLRPSSVVLCMVRAQCNALIMPEPFTIFEERRLCRQRRF